MEGDSKAVLREIKEIKATFSQILDRIQKIEDHLLTPNNTAGKFQDKVDCTSHK